MGLTLTTEILPMITKSYAKNGKTCKVTFKVAADLAAEKGAVMGDFNEWNAEALPLVKRKDGGLSATVSLEAGKDYTFRYLIDGTNWMNDEAPDGFSRNQYGGQDCVLKL